MPTSWSLLLWSKRLNKARNHRTTFWEPLAPIFLQKPSLALHPCKESAFALKSTGVALPEPQVFVFIFPGSGPLTCQGLKPASRKQWRFPPKVDLPQFFTGLARAPLAKLSDPDRPFTPFCFSHPSICKRPSLQG